jgi:hypothetical protein
VRKDICVFLSLLLRDFYFFSFALQRARGTVELCHLPEGLLPSYSKVFEEIISFETHFHSPFFVMLRGCVGFV